jgi:hypothetical protein
MSPAKFIFVKAIEKPNDKFGKPYLKITDHENSSWSFFRSDFKPELNKCYEFTYELNANGFPDVSKITPLVNLFQIQALKDTANRNDILRNYFMCLSYAKDIYIAKNQPLEMSVMFDLATQMYDWVNSKSDEAMAKINSQDKEIK